MFIIYISFIQILQLKKVFSFQEIQSIFAKDWKGRFKERFEYQEDI